MGYAGHESSDWEKLQHAWRELSGQFGSVEQLTESFGLHTLPVAQQYGIVLGCLTFACTVGAVLLLLIYGGSLQRLQEQAATGHVTLQSPTEARKQRPLLLEHLLTARHWMIQRNYNNYYSASAAAALDSSSTNNKKNTVAEEDKFTPLTTMFCHVAPPRAHALPNLLLNSTSHTTTKEKDDDDDDDDSKQQQQQQQLQQLSEMRQQMPQDYELLYKQAYRACQDQPGGATLPGRPEARYEAYARAYAGCGHAPICQTAYRRSYARLYEATACQNGSTETRYSTWFETRPHDIVGRYVRLEALDADRHAAELHAVTCGAPTASTKGFAPDELWAFVPQGPFDTEQELRQSTYLFGTQARRQQQQQRQKQQPQSQQASTKKAKEASGTKDESNHNNSNDDDDDDDDDETNPMELRHCAYFAIRHNVTDQLLGWIGLSHDHPWSLSIQLEPPIVAPQWSNTNYDLEASFLLLDKCLYGYGYRRVQLCLDAHDAVRRHVVAQRLFFTLEGVLYRHAVVKQASRDSNLYALLNSDWQHGNGPRARLLAHLYGKATLQADRLNEAREAEREAQEWNLFLVRTNSKNNKNNDDKNNSSSNNKNDKNDNDNKAEQEEEEESKKDKEL
ncbi:hypothetical protein ACA910_017603 [Epithemia clementina (nom. ined.)]